MSRALSGTNERLCGSFLRRVQTSQSNNLREACEKDEVLTIAKSPNLFVKALFYDLFYLVGRDRRHSYIGRPPRVCVRQIGL